MLIIECKNLFHLLEFSLHLFLSFKKLLDKLILSIDLLFKDVDYKVFRRKHVLQVASKGVETMMRIPLRLFFVD